MEPIKLNLATRGEGDNRVLLRLLVGAGLLVLILTGYTVATWMRNHAVLMDQRGRIEALVKRQKEELRASKRAAPAITKEEASAYLKQAKAVNRLIMEDQYPWDRLLDDLERRLPDGVILLRFASTERFDRIVLRGRADDLQGVTLFLENVKTSPVMTSMKLLNLSVSRAEGPLAGRKADAALDFEIEGTVHMEGLL